MDKEHIVVKWLLIPLESPKIIRNCSKCGNQKKFINTYNFRINANSSLLDIWMIYKCEKCNTTYNLSIEERIKNTNLDKSLYKKYEHNDSSLALELSLNSNIMKKNHVEVDWNNVKFEVKKKIEYGSYMSKLSIINDFNLSFRVDKLLASYSELSRNKINKYFEMGDILIQGQNIKKISNQKEIILEFRNNDLINEFK